MPEVILPCPASMNDAELLKLKHRFDDVCQSSTTSELFELCRAGSHLVDTLRSIPRALTWTHEPPNVAGWYWCRQCKSGVTLCVEVYGASSFLLFGSKRDDFNPQRPVTVDGIEWAGPIAPPVEG